MRGEPFTAVGRIVKTHGLRGEVSVKPYTEASLSSLTGLETWFVPPADTVRSARIADVRPGPKGPVVSFDGISGVDDARELSGREMLVKTDSLPEGFMTESDSPDMVGVTVMDVESGLLGKVEEVIVTGANDVWVVQGPLGEVLLPVIDEVVLGYDEESDTVRVRALPGLLPEREDTK